MGRLISTVLAGAIAIALVGGAGCAATAATGGSNAAAGSAASEGAVRDSSWHDSDLGCGWEATGSLELAHATQFAIDEYDGGYRLISCASGERYLVVPEGSEAPAGLSDDIAVIHQPLDDVYLVSTGMICLLDELGALNAVTVASVTPETSPNDDLTAGLEDGSIVYGGRYRDPDYELIAERGCSLAIENTQIHRYPEVRQKLEDLGVTVFTEQSSTEDEVLGRLEWIRAMGVLFGREAEADAAYERICANVERVAAEEPTGRTVAFFYIDSDGSAVVRRSGDYFAQMIELAGGEAVSFDPEAGSDASHTTYITVEMEEFFARAKDADVIIYNSTVDESVETIDALVARNPLLADFAAVRSGEVYACDANLYQQMTSTDGIISDIRAALTGDSDPSEFIWRLARS